jgi:hypothetical protein
MIQHQQDGAKRQAENRQEMPFFRQRRRRRPQMRKVHSRGEGIASDRNSKPVEEVGQWIYNLQLAHSKESGGAEHHRENRVADERADVHKELRREVIGVLVEYISGRVSESKPWFAG